MVVRRSCKFRLVPRDDDAVFFLGDLKVGCTWYGNNPVFPTLENVCHCRSY